MASERVEELPDDFNENLDLNKPPRTAAPPSSSNDIPPSFEAMLAAAGPAFPSKKGSSSASKDPPVPAVPSAAMPPAMESVKQHTADEVLELMNKVPLFMTTLDETDADGGENMELEALKALAYEGTRAEVAGNFREQGNDMAKAKRWVDAREFYDKALGALKMPERELRGLEESEDGAVDMEVVETDPLEEARKERAIEEASWVNRALCSLEMKNYGTCKRDCAAVLRINPKNVKAWYRSASACLALDKIDEAEDACTRGLEVEAENAALKALSTKIEKRKQHLEGLERKRREREERKRLEEATLKLALKSRNIPARTTEKGPDMEDAAMHLEDPVDPASTLSIPAVFLYPEDMQSDFIKGFREDESVGQHLTYTMPLPWDEKHEYTPQGVECYIETISGGLIKAGKKLSLLRLLNSGKIELVDGMLKVNVVPKAKVSAWIEKFKQRRVPS